MAKRIADVIEDRIGDGFDAMAAKILMAKASEFARVREVAQIADAAVQEVMQDLAEISRVREECLEARRAEKERRAQLAADRQRPLFAADATPDVAQVPIPGEVEPEPDDAYCELCGWVGAPDDLLQLEGPDEPRRCPKCRSMAVSWPEELLGDDDRGPERGEVDPWDEAAPSDDEPQGVEADPWDGGDTDQPESADGDGESEAAAGFSDGEAGGLEVEGAP